MLLRKGVFFNKYICVVFGGGLGWGMVEKLDYLDIVVM